MSEASGFCHGPWHLLFFVLAAVVTSLFKDIFNFISLNIETTFTLLIVLNKTPRLAVVERSILGSQVQRMQNLIDENALKKRPERQLTKLGGAQRNRHICVSCLYALAVFISKRRNFFFSTFL